MNLYESRNNTKILLLTSKLHSLKMDGGGTQFLDFVRTIEEVLNQLSSVGEMYLRSKWCMFFLLWAPHSDHLVSRLTTNFWQSYREAHARRKLGGKEEVKLKMRHSWYFGNHIRHQGRIYVVMATTTRSNRPRKTTMESIQGQPPDGRARRGTRNNCMPPPGRSIGLETARPFPSKKQPTKALSTTARTLPTYMFDAAIAIYGYQDNRQR